MPPKPPRFVRAAAACGTVTLVVSGCTLLGTDNDDGDEAGKTVVELATHDSWNVPDDVIHTFEQRHDIDLRVRKQGDAGALANKLVLTKDDPVADVAYGVDSTFASRTLSEGVFAEYRSPNAKQGPQRYALAGDDRLSAVDLGDVCVNIDSEWFAEQDVDPPESYADLTESRYEDMTVTASPATSSPGLAFLFGTIAEFGTDGWQDYWHKLDDNGLRVVSGWTEAYNENFSGASEDGDRPIVVSYASSPAAEMTGSGKSNTRALLDTCYRQVEYAGVLAGAEHPKKAQQVVDFLLSERFQSAIAENMYVYPTREDVSLPSGWDEAAPKPTDTDELGSEQVAEHRKQWIDQWRKLFN